MNKELKPNDIIPFVRSKDYKFVQNLGTGSFAKTVLIKDEILDELYACKKYEPSTSIVDINERKRYFNKFIKEIKILNKIVHPNIVRIYNNYIYQNEQVGYIIMEYVENAKSLDEYIKNNTHMLNNVFEQIINGFCYLEQCNLCHRDIRSNNILINSEGVVKIIDFGFGKFYSIDNNVSPLTLYKNNWIAILPSEMNTRDDNVPIYNNKTEIYFVGQLVKQIIEENSIKNFRYMSIVNEMIEYNAFNRIKSFSEVKNKISETGIQGKKIFNDEDKRIYKEIVEKLDEIIETVDYDTSVNEINIIIEKLELISAKYCLEDIVLNNIDFAECFFEKSIKVKEASTEWDFLKEVSYEKNTIPTSLITKSINWLTQCNDRQRKLIKQNLQGHLEKYDTNYTDLPF